MADPQNDLDLFLLQRENYYRDVLARMSATPSAQRDKRMADCQAGLAVIVRMRRHRAALSEAITAEDVRRIDADHAAFLDAQKPFDHNG